MHEPEIDLKARYETLLVETQKKDAHIRQLMDDNLEHRRWRAAQERQLEPLREQLDVWESRAPQDSLALQAGTASPPGYGYQERCKYTTNPHHNLTSNDQPEELLAISARERRGSAGSVTLADAPLEVRNAFVSNKVSRCCF